MSRLTLRVLGSAGTHPGRGRACSSYLVEADGYRLLLDCGNGSLANLQRTVDVTDVDAVLISHLHPDHFADLYGLYYALRFHPNGPSSVPIHAPAGAADFIGQLLPEDSLDDFRERCRFTVLARGDELDLGPTRVTLFEASHPVEAFACRVAVDDRVIAYSGDSGPTPDLVDCARDADLFVCDATWLERNGPFPEGLHMTGAQAGRIAADAGARSLVVTHVFPATDPADVAAEASRTFGGTVTAAEDLHEHEL